MEAVIPQIGAMKTALPRDPGALAMANQFAKPATVALQQFQKAQHAAWALDNTHTTTLNASAAASVAEHAARNRLDMADKLDAMDLQTADVKRHQRRGQILIHYVCPALLLAASILVFLEIHDWAIISPWLHVIVLRAAATFDNLSYRSDERSVSSVDALTTDGPSDRAYVGGVAAAMFQMLVAPYSILLYVYYYLCRDPKTHVVATTTLMRYAFLLGYEDAIMKLAEVYPVLGIYNTLKITMLLVSLVAVHHFHKLRKFNSSYDEILAPGERVSEAAGRKARELGVTRDFVEHVWIKLLGVNREKPNLVGDLKAWTQGDYMQFHFPEANRASKARYCAVASMLVKDPTPWDVINYEAQHTTNMRDSKWVLPPPVEQLTAAAWGLTPH